MFLPGWTWAARYLAARRAAARPARRAAARAPQPRGTGTDDQLKIDCRPMTRTGVTADWPEWNRGHWLEQLADGSAKGPATSPEHQRASIFSLNSLSTSARQDRHFGSATELMDLRGLPDSRALV
jgi:hypothetical protein